MNEFCKLAPSTSSPHWAAHHNHRGQLTELPNATTDDHDVIDMCDAWNEDATWYDGYMRSQTCNAQKWCACQASTDMDLQHCPPQTDNIGVFRIRIASERFFVFLTTIPSGAMVKMKMRVSKVRVSLSDVG